MWQKCRSNFFAWNWILLKWKKDPDPGSCFIEKRIGFLDPALVGKMDLDPGSCFSENRIGFLDPASVKKRIRILDISEKRIGFLDPVSGGTKRSLILLLKKTHQDPHHREKIYVRLSRPRRRWMTRSTTWISRPSSPSARTALTWAS